MASAVPERNEKPEKEPKVQVKLRRQNTMLEKGRKTSGDKRRSGILFRWFKYLSEGTSDNRQKKQKDATSNLPTRPVSMVVPDPSSHMEGDGSTDQNKTDNKSQSNLYSKPSKSQSLDSLEKLDHVEVHSVVEPPLAHPSDVTAKSIVVNIAPPVQSPHERLKEKDKIIDSALQEKRIIIAKMYGVPIDEFTNISEMAAEAKTDSEKDVQEIILASIHQAEQLTCLVSSSLSPENAKAEAVRPAQSPNTREQDSEVELSPSRDNIKDSDGSSTQDKVHRSGTLTDYEAEPQHGEAGPPKVDQKSDEDGNGGKDVKGTVVTSGAKSDSKDVYVSLPSGKLLAITSKLNAQLHHLMEAMAANEKEQERLQDQLKAAQEQVASLLGSQKSAGDSMSPTSRPNSYISITSSTSEAGETLEEHETNVESPSLVSSISESSRTCTDDSSRVAQDDMPSDTKVCTLEYILGGNTDGDNQLECRDTVCEPEKETKQVEEVGKPEEHTESKPVAEENTEVKQAESDQEQQTANKSHQNKAEVSDERNSDEEDVDEDFVDAEDGTNEGSSEAVPKEVTTSTEDEAEPRISSTETSDSVEPTSMKTNGDDAPSAVTPDSSEIHCELMDKSDLRPPEDSQTVPPVDEKSAGVTTETTDEENN